MTTKKLLALAAIQRELNFALADLASMQSDFWETFDRLAAAVDAIGSWVDEPLGARGYFRETVQ